MTKPPTQAHALLWLALIALAFSGPETFETAVLLWGVIALTKGQLKFSRMVGLGCKVRLSAKYAGFVLMSLIGIAGIEFAWIGLATYLIPSSASKIQMATRDGSFSLFCAALLVPVIEEVVMRGFLLNLLARRFGVITGLIASSVFFGLLHGEYVGHTVMGLLLGVIYISSGSLWLAIGVHCLNNGLARALEYFGPDFFKNEPGFFTTPAQSWHLAEVGIFLTVLGVPFLCKFLETYWPRSNDNDIPGFTTNQRRSFFRSR